MFPPRKYDFNYQRPSVVNGLTTLDDINRVSPFFTDTNPVTYAIFLQANESKLSEYEIEKTKNLMNHLLAKEREAMELISQYLKDKREYENICEEVDNKVNELIADEVNNVVYDKIHQSVSVDESDS